MLANPLTAKAVTAGYVKGANNEHLYEEIVFITGEPLKFSGNFEVIQKDKNDTRTTTYKYNLTCIDLTEKTKLTRTITFTTDFDQRSDKGQVIATTKVGKYTEKLEIGKDKFELTHFQLSQSDVIDLKPAADFYFGNFRGRKVYKINKDDGEVVVEISDTQILDFTLASRRYIDEEGSDRREVNWEGTARLTISDSIAKSLRYSDNEASLSSFEGGYIRTTDREKVAELM